MQREKVLVTGASGYIGKNLVTELLNQNFQVIASDIVNKGIDDRATVVIGDIFNNSVTYYEDLGKPDILIHLAWKDGFNHNSPYHLQYIFEHFQFIERLVNSGLKKVAVLGSMHEIGYINGMITEDTPANPKSYYGIAKNALRGAMTALLEGREDVILQWIRGYYLLGDDKNNHSIFSKLIQAHEEGKIEFPFTTGKNKYDFLSISDFVKQITAVIAQDDVCGVIECCSGTSTKLNDKAEEFIKENRLNVKLKYGAYPDREYDSPETYGDNRKIKKVMESQRKREKNER